MTRGFAALLSANRPQRFSTVCWDEMGRAQASVPQSAFRNPHFHRLSLYNHQPPAHIPPLIMWLSILIPILLGILVLVCLLLVLVVLMQRPRSEGLGAAFGSGMTENIFGAQTSTVLTKATVYLGGIFFVVTLILTFLTAKQSLERRVGVLEGEAKNAKPVATPSVSASPSAIASAAGSVAPGPSAATSASPTNSTTATPEPTATAGSTPAATPQSSPSANNSGPSPSATP
jgi:preprotein translocase subunit SecG